MVIKVFPIILLILEHKIKCFILIFSVFSGKNDADNLARITVCEPILAEHLVQWFPTFSSGDSNRELLAITVTLVITCSRTSRLW